MMRAIAAFLGLMAFGVANAAIIDLGNVTRDTGTGLDWLDLTETRGMRWEEVYVELRPGGHYEGWRYATAAELDQLIANFGYTPNSSGCRYDVIYCDLGDYDGERVEYMVRTLGDTYDAHLDEINYTVDIAESGAGYAAGYLGEYIQDSFTAYIAVGRIGDNEVFNRYTGEDYRDQPDLVSTIVRYYDITQGNPTYGSFLVRPTVVPLPAAGLLFVSALAAIGWRTRRPRR